MLHPFNSSGGMGRRTCPSRSSSGAAGGAHLKKGIFSPRRIDRERKIRYNRLCFPSRPARYAHVAQGIEHSPPKRRVGRSNRLRRAKIAAYQLLLSTVGVLQFFMGRYFLLTAHFLTGRSKHAYPFLEENGRNHWAGRSCNLPKKKSLEPIGFQGFCSCFSAWRTGARGVRP